MNINKVTIGGRLGADPELRAFPNGGCICMLRVATNESYKNKSTGELVTKTQWHRIVLRNGLAEVANKYLQKGDRALFEGSNKTRSWQDRDNNTKYVTEVVASELHLIDGRRFSNGGSDAAPADETDSQTDSNGGYHDDDIPFQAYMKGTIA